LWIASAFGGHGLNTTAMAGGLLARAIVENDDSWRLFLPYDLVWAGGAFGRAIRHGMSVWKNRSDKIAAGAARRREKLRVEEVELEADVMPEPPQSEGPAVEKSPVVESRIEAPADDALPVISPVSDEAAGPKVAGKKPARKRRTAKKPPVVDGSPE
jgi:hypothetical protein